MPPFPRWAELPPELLGRIGDSLDIKSYATARGSCKAWRCAFAPPSPSLLLVPADAGRCPSPSAASLSMRRAFELRPVPEGAEPVRVVGSSNGWLALASGWSIFSLFNPVTAAEVALPPLIQESGEWVSKLVFAPSPATDDFAAAAVYGTDRLAYVTAGARRWAVLDPVRLAHGDHLTDLLYHEKEGRAMVYCLTSYGDVHVLHLPERRRREPVADEPPSLPATPVILRRSRELTAPPDRAENDRRRRALQQLQMIHRRSFGPDLNAPATVDPLLSLPFDAATSFAPPYKKVSVFTGAKHLVFCEGNLYQIWRNSSCTVTMRLPGGGRRRVAENEVFVLRYYPDRQPCWDAVTDLGGYSVFVGRNNAVSMPNAEGIPGLKGNCVYWIGGKCRDQGMVFDMATQSSTACLLPPAAFQAAPQSTICWYFLNDMVMNNRNNINGGQRVH